MKKILMLGLVMLTSGCASIISDSNYPVTLQSSPEGAKFEINDMSTGMTLMEGRTPATVTLDASSGFFSGADYTVAFSKDGYHQQTFPLNSSLDGWYVVNILFGGLIGLFIIDPATGAMWSLDNTVTVSLSEKENSDTNVSIINTNKYLYQ